MQTNTKQTLTAMKLLAWVIFIGLCIKTGAIIISFFVSLFGNAKAAEDLYLGLDLSALHRFDIRQYIFVVFLLVALSGLKAYIFYLVVLIFLKTDFTKPFHRDLTALITRIGKFSLGTGVLALLANVYTEWLAKKGVLVSQTWGSAEFLFMGGVVFLVAIIFKRGVEIQSENDLTV